MARAVDIELVVGALLLVSELLGEIPLQEFETPFGGRFLFGVLLVGGSIVFHIDLLITMVNSCVQALGPARPSRRYRSTPLLRRISFVVIADVVFGIPFIDREVGKMNELVLEDALIVRVLLRCETGKTLVVKVNTQRMV